MTARSSQSLAIKLRRKLTATLRVRAKRSLRRALWRNGNFSRSAELVQFIFAIFCSRSKQEEPAKVRRTPFLTVSFGVITDITAVGQSLLKRRSYDRLATTA